MFKYYCTTKLRGKTNVFLWNLKVLFNCSVAKGMCQTRQFANHGLWLLICCHLAFPALFLFLSLFWYLQALITTRFVELIYRIFFWRFAALECILMQNSKVSCSEFFLKTRAAVAPDPDVWIAKSMPCIFKAATFSMISFFVLISRQ